ncbi:hypothetical protein SDC9_80700 [bioreactor metagenome]|uniref:Uncharacterized protein n=1 Tax=bioreactor metagenome TaxID=1076179 RepID=A0A644Z1E2_9ZZZZ
MGNPQLDGLGNGKPVVLHKVVDRQHRAVDIVFNRQHAVFAQSAPYSPRHPFKAFHKRDIGSREQLVAGNGGISPLNALTGNGRPSRQLARRAFERLFNVGSKGCLPGR